MSGHVDIPIQRGVFSLVIPSWRSEILSEIQGGYIYNFSSAHFKCKLMNLFSFTQNPEANARKPEEEN